MEGKRRKEREKRKKERAPSNHRERLYIHRKQSKIKRYLENLHESGVGHERVVRYAALAIGVEQRQRCVMLLCVYVCVYVCMCVCMCVCML